MKKRPFKSKSAFYLGFFLLLACNQAATTITETNETTTLNQVEDTLIEEDFEITSIKNELEQLSPFKINDSTSIHIAQKLSCGVIVKNPNPNDKWTEKALSGLDRKAFVDMIFEAVYSSKVKAYEYLTNKELTIEEVREIDNENSRDKIAKIQFVEEWFIDPDKFTLSKRVRSAMLGYENNLVEGVVETYRPGIKVNFNLQ